MKLLIERSSFSSSIFSIQAKLLKVGYCVSRRHRGLSYHFSTISYWRARLNHAHWIFQTVNHNYKSKAQHKQTTWWCQEIKQRQMKQFKRHWRRNALVKAAKAARLIVPPIVGASSVARIWIFFWTTWFHPNLGLSSKIFLLNELSRPIHFSLYFIAQYILLEVLLQSPFWKMTPPSSVNHLCEMNLFLGSGAVIKQRRYRFP